MSKFVYTLVNKIADAIAGGASWEKTTSVSSVPTPREDLESLTTSVKSLKNIVDTLTGNGGTVFDKALTVSDMMEAGLITYDPALGLSSGSQVTPLPGGGGGGGGGGDPGYVDPRPILPVPATATGLTVLGTFHSVVMSWSIVDYQNHAYMEIWRSTEDNLGTAVLINISTANVYTDATTVAGTVYYYWIRAVNYEGVAGAFNSVTGTSGGPGIIENVDLGLLIVEAKNLATGAVTADKLDDGIIDATKFASGIEPVTIVTGSLPTIKSTINIFWLGDNKLYRWNGSAYIKAVDGNDIVAGTVTAGKIAAGAIGTDQIAANAITTDKLLVTGIGPALNPDPNTRDKTAWTPNDESYVTWITDTTSPTGYAMRVSGAHDIFTTPLIPFNVGKSYNVRMSVKLETGPAPMYLAIQFFDGNKVALNSGSAGATGWPATDGTYFYFGRLNQAPSSSWAEYAIAFGSTEPVRPPSASAFFSLGGRFNYLSTGIIRMTNVRMMEMTNTDLIVTGGITATKLAANSIAVGTAAIQNGAITNFMLGTGSVENIHVSVGLSAVKITVGEMSGDRITARTLHGDRITAGEITATEINSTTLNSNNVLTRNLTVRDNSGNIILSSGQPLQVANSASGLVNANVTINADGTLSNAGTGQVTITGLDSTVVRSANPINTGNVSTYIAAGAIGNLYIGNFIQSTNFNGLINPDGSFSSKGTMGWALGKAGEAVIRVGSFQSTTSGKRIVLNEGGDNEARFYGDRGDGTIELLATLGIKASGADSAIGFFGTPTSDRYGIVAQSRNTVAISAAAYGTFFSAIVGTSIDRGVGVIGQSSGEGGIGVLGTCNGTTSAAVQGQNTSGKAIYGSSSTGFGVDGNASTSGTGVRGTSATGYGVEGNATNSGPGVYGHSTHGYGGSFAGNTSSAPLFLSPQTSAPVSSAVGQIAVVLSTGTGKYELCFYTNIGGWVKVRNTTPINDADV